MRRVNLIGIALAIVASAAAVTVMVYVRRHAYTAEAPSEPVDGICHPRGINLDRIGWPSYRVCSDSHGYHTCWRLLDHTGRHCEWDLATGVVLAVWPCTPEPEPFGLIAAEPHMEAA